MGSYPTVSPLPAPGEAPAAGGLFSVALSVGLPRPAVSWHPALWCPDFPHPEGLASGRDRTPVPGHPYSTTGKSIEEIAHAPGQKPA